MKFCYQIVFRCYVPQGYTVIKDFAEQVQSDIEPDAGIISQIISKSVENAGIEIKDLFLSQDNKSCVLILGDDPRSINVFISVKPSLVIGDKIFKLEEFEI